MLWKYCFPHLWDRPRQVWEDVYLRPASPQGAPRIHLTVDALGDADDPDHGSDRAEYQTQVLDKLRDAEFFLSKAPT
jgi:hypothetical protein